MIVLMRTEQSMAVHDAAVGDANHKLKRSNVTEGRGIGRATGYGYGFLSREPLHSPSLCGELKF